MLCSSLERSLSAPLCPSLSGGDAPPAFGASSTAGGAPSITLSLCARARVCVCVCVLCVPLSPALSARVSLAVSAVDTHRVTAGRNGASTPVNLRAVECERRVSLSVTGWVGEMTEELRVPCDHLEKLHCCAHQY